MEVAYALRHGALGRERSTIKPGSREGMPHTCV